MTIDILYIPNIKKFFKYENLIFINFLFSKLKINYIYRKL